MNPSDLLNEAVRIAWLFTRKRCDAEDFAAEAIRRLLASNALEKENLYFVIRNIAFDNSKRHSTKKNDSLDKALDDGFYIIGEQDVTEPQANLPQVSPMLSMLADGHDYNEIASFYRIPVGTVKSRISRERKKLIRLIGEK